MITASGSVGSAESPRSSPRAAGELCHSCKQLLPGEEGSPRSPPCCVCRPGARLGPFQEQPRPRGCWHQLGPCSQPTPRSVPGAGPSGRALCSSTREAPEQEPRAQSRHCTLLGWLPHAAQGCLPWQLPEEPPAPGGPLHLQGFVTMFLPSCHQKERLSRSSDLQLSADSNAVVFQKAPTTLPSAVPLK